MSLNMLTSEVLKRDISTGTRVPGIGGYDVEDSGNGPRFLVRRGGADGTMLSQSTISRLSSEADENNMVTGSLNLLVKYIPTEVITLYVATLSATPALQEVFPRVQTGDIYWCFTIITPLLLFLVYVNKRATAGLTPEVIQNDIVGDTGEETLTLITCGGEFDPATGEYNERWVVRANQI